MTIEFKGFDDWIPIFKGGKQVDSTGREHDGDALIDNAVTKFNAAKHEPPAVIGHPAENAPAYGWVEKLKKENSLLLAKFKQVQPDFANMVKQGLFKKRSAAFYPDGSLRHVGFLGAAPPAVKGLPDMSFTEEGISFEFQETGTSPWTWDAISGFFRRIREYLIEKEGAEKADQVIPEYSIKEITDEAQRAEEKLNEPGGGEVPSGLYNQQNGGNKMKFSEFLEVFKFWKEVEKDPDANLPDIKGTQAAQGKTFSEADVEAAKKEAVEKAKKDSETAFAEQQKRTARKSEIASMIDQGIAEKKILPAWKEAGLAAFMESLEPGGEIQFSEEKKTNQYTWFKEFLEGLGKPDIFKVIATKNKASEFAEGEKDAALGKAIAAKA